jgi:GntR family transcriptional regulator
VSDEGRPASGQAETMPWIRLERDGPHPLQAQIVRWIESMIVSGALAPRARLPSEATLVERLGVSRVTVRLAFDDLVARGLVSRSHGRGSFVAASLVQHDLRSDQAFFDIILAQATKPEAQLLAFEPAVPPDAVAGMFGLSDGRPAMRFMRLYLAARRPVALASGWLTPDATALSWADVEARSTAALHADVLRHPVATTTMSITAEMASGTVARQLEMKSRSPVLILIRSRFDSQQRLREYLRFIVDPKSYEFTLSFGDLAIPEAVLRAVAARSGDAGFGAGRRQATNCEVSGDA